MRFNKQSGQVLVGTAVALVVLCGFAGLAIDMGTLRFQKRLEQTAADSAAIAGAQNLSFTFGVTAPGRAAATQNGFTDNNGGAGCVGGAVGCTSVAVNNPPLNGPHATNAAYVEVIVTQIQPTYFMNLFGVSKEPVTARAVATNISGGTTYNCLLTLGPPTNSITGIDVQGKADLNAPNCGIADNGNLDTTGNAYTVEASTMSVTGSCLGGHCGYPDVQCSSSPTGNCGPLSGAPATGNPLSALQAPSQPAYSSSCPAVPPAGTCDYSSSGNVTIQPGTYNSISVGKNSTVTMAPGIYYINGPITVGKTTSGAGLNMDGTGELIDTGNPGVMLYFTGGSTMNKVVGGGSNPDMRLDPMTTAEDSTYAGILMYQDPADTAQAYVGGDNNSVFNGTIYMPTATLNFFGNATVTFNGSVIAYSVDIQGSPIVTFGQSPSGVPIPALLTQPILVE